MASPETAGTGPTARDVPNAADAWCIPHPVRQLPSLRSRDDGSSTRPQSTSAVRIRSPFNRGERQSHDAAASRRDLGILCGVAP